MNLAYGQGGLKLEINIPPQHISAKSKGGLIIEGGVSSSEYGMQDTIVMSASVVAQASRRTQLFLAVEYMHGATVM